MESNTETPIHQIKLENPCNTTSLASVYQFLVELRTQLINADVKIIERLTSTSTLDSEESMVNITFTEHGNMSFSLDEKQGGVVVWKKNMEFLLGLGTPAFIAIPLILNTISQSHKVSFSFTLSNTQQ